MKQKTLTHGEVRDGGRNGRQVWDAALREWVPAGGRPLRPRQHGPVAKRIASEGRVWERAARLVGIVYELALSPDGLTAHALAVRFRVNKRSIYRDIASLLLAELPLERLPSTSDIPPRIRFRHDPRTALQLRNAVAATRLEPAS